MRHLHLWMMLVPLAFIGCPAPPSDGDVDAPAAPADAAPADAGADAADETADAAPADADGADQAAAPAADATPAPAADGADQAAAPAPIAAPAVSGAMQLTPENTTIQFVGIHSGDKPDPRTGKFHQFTGAAEVTDGKLTSISVDIDVESLKTDAGQKLDDHLKSADFFDAKQFPKAMFKSTKIEAAGDGKATITGDLTLLKTTKSISFPATVSTDDGLKVNAEFTIDRNEFGMTYGEGKVEKDVAMSIAVAAKK